MTIRTKRLVLRPFQNSDKDWYFEFVQNEELKKWLPNLATTSYEEAAQCVDVFAKGIAQNYFYVIEDMHKNVMGIIIAIRITSNTIDVAYFLKEEYRHKGFMTEALRCFAYQIRSKERGIRFRLVIDEDNIESLNVAQRLGTVVTSRDDRYLCYF